MHSIAATHNSAALSKAADDLRETTEWMVSQGDPNDRFAGATAYLSAFALTLGAAAHLKAAAAEGTAGPRSALAAFYLARILPAVAAHLAQSRAGASGLYKIDADGLAM